MIALILIGLTLPATAQHVEYRYDAAGNRILKQIVLARTQARKRMAATSDKVANVYLMHQPHHRTTSHRGDQS